MGDGARRTVRTVLQLVLGLLAGLPLLVHTAGLPGTLPGLGVVLGIAAGVTRVMALPVVDQLLPAWLRAASPVANPLPLAVVPPTTD